MPLSYRGTGIDLGNTRLTSVAAGVNPTDGVNYQQLANAIGGIQYKGAAIAATTSNITLSGEQTIDGVTTSASRVLVKNQTNAAQNGIYLSSSGAWTLASDANTSVNVQNGDIVTVEPGGNVNGKTQWQLTTLGTITPGTTSQTWSQISFGIQYTPGTGINISTAGVISSLGTLKWVGPVPAGSTTATITHTLNTTFIEVKLYDVSGSNPVEVLSDPPTVTSATTFTLTFNTAPAAGQYQVVVIG